ncbi:MAG: hypothetical protein K8H88_07560, partial [Sandaracinaceae bacterium]|nr:hypothetical protein [Sandaracinaceae bacterium]
QLLGTTTLGDQFRFESQRLRAILLTALPFMRERVADHRARGDVIEWSTTLHERMGETMTSPLGAALMRFLAAIDADPEARSALSRLMAYLVDEASANDAFASTLYGLTDAMMVLEDEDNLLPILHALADGMAPNARGVVAGTDPALDTEASAIRDLLELTSEIRDLDTQRTLPRILQNAAALPETGDEITPIEVLIDVIAEVNRAAPGAGGTMSADDYRAAFGQTVDFMTDERRGMERLYDVIQNRQLAPTAP